MRYCRSGRSRARRRSTRKIPTADFMNLLKIALAVLVSAAALAQTVVEVVPVVAKNLDRHAKLPGEFQPYLAVPIHAKISGFVEQVTVDRGSMVKKGQVLVK